MSAPEPAMGVDLALEGPAGAAGLIPGDLQAAKKRSSSPWRQPLAVVGMVVVVAWIVVAIFAPLIAPSDPLAQDFVQLKGPSAEHWLGTDELGRDVMSRIVYGARVSLPLAVLLVLGAMIFGSIVGSLAGFFGGWVDAVGMRLADIVFAFPGIILAMAVAAALGPELLNAVLAVIVVSWPAYARLVRGLVLSARGSQYVIASRLLGASCCARWWSTSGRMCSDRSW